ncbi:MAG: sirohydrochlorin cobaltochelatase [Negativicutes bacterium]|nr:sirohydrochlorin cobaltochelatase [Negativicutes bacterium]MBP9537437.1 sirohydrochlorin cobaltochelatase [Negativicutes bacterium]
MMMMTTIGMILGSSNDVLACGKCGNEKNHQAIVVVSFGTTFDDAREKCIESVENKITEMFPFYEVRRAFTSNIVMKRLAEKGIMVDNLEQALTKLKNEEYTDVIIQSTHLIPGEEYNTKILEVAAKHKNDFQTIKIGRPVLTYSGDNNTNDYKEFVKALKKQLPQNQGKDTQIIFMGHGSNHENGTVYSKLQLELDKQGVKGYVAVVEDGAEPSFDSVLKKLANNKETKKVLLMPLMLVAGDHANNDMAGEEEDSWKSILTAKGYAVEIYMHGLGENKAFQDIYVEHIKDAIAGK